MAHLQAFLVQLEPILVLLAATIFFKSGSARRFPAMAAYLAVYGGSTLLLTALLWHFTPSPTPNLRYDIYFYAFWISYIACAISIFFVLQEIFKHVMEPVPGLRRLGLLGFRWISIVSVVVSVGAIALPASIAAPNGDRMGPIALQLMRCVSVMEICLMAFLGLSIHALGRSFRSRIFGIGLGFGLQAAAELIASALLARHPNMISGTNLFVQATITVVLVTWSVYFLVPEPRADRDRVVLAPTSPLSRWNSLANGLGQMPQVATAQSSTGFFLQDIEGVVERVLAKNPVINNR